MYALMKKILFTLFMLIMIMAGLGCSEKKSLHQTSEDKFSIIIKNAHKGEISAITFSPDGKRILSSSSSEDGLKLWKLNGKLIRTFPTKGVTAIAYDPQNNYIFSGHKDGVVKRWSIKGEDVSDINQLEKMYPDNLLFALSRIDSLTLSSTGTYLAAGGKRLEDAAVKIWRVDGIAGETMGRTMCAKLFKSEYTEQIIRSMDISSDGRFLTFSTGGEIIIFSIDENKILKELASFASKVAFTPDKRHIIYNESEPGLSDTIKVMNFIGEWTPRTLETKTEAIEALDFSSDCKYVAIATNKTIKIWDFNNNNPQILKGHVTDIVYLSFSPDKKHLVSVAKDNTIRIWDIAKI